MWTIFWFAVIWLIPLWFLFRLWYFTNKYERGYTEFDGVSKGFSFFFVLVISWLGLFLSALLVGCHREHVARTFFIPVREKSMAAKIFWYKVRIFGLRLLFIKESE